MTTNIVSNTFTFRNKFEKFLNDENRPIITGAFQKFCGFTHDRAFSILWQFTYKPREVPFIFQELGLEVEDISDEMLSVLINELRYQYENLNSKFCRVKIPDELQEAFTVFTNATNTIVSQHVYERASQKMYSPEEVEINLSKMVNEKAYMETRIKAIKFFSFGQLEAQYLYAYRTHLHIFLKKMYELNLLPMCHSFPNTPFEGLDTRLKNAGFDLPFFMKEVASEPAKEEPKANCGFKSLTSEEILEHKDVFACFASIGDMNVLLQIGLLGFDLNNVMAKKDIIKNLLNANENYCRTQAELLMATQANNEAYEELINAAKALSN